MTVVKLSETVQVTNTPYNAEYKDEQASIQIEQATETTQQLKLLNERFEEAFDTKITKQDIET